MLVLSRRAGESVMIGDDVVITVLEVRGDIIRLGINAPRQVQVHREEVYRELQAANRDAASPSDRAVQALSQLLHVPGEPGHDRDGGRIRPAAPGAVRGRPGPITPGRARDHGGPAKPDRPVEASGAADQARTD
jgi:carbon storage regulator